MGKSWPPEVEAPSPWWGNSDEGWCSPCFLRLTQPRILSGKSFHLYIIKIITRRCSQGILDSVKLAVNTNCPNAISISASVSFPLAVMKYPEERDLRKKGFALAHSFTKARKLRHRQLEAGPLCLQPTNWEQWRLPTFCSFSAQISNSSTFQLRNSAYGLRTT